MLPRHLRRVEVAIDAVEHELMVVARHLEDSALLLPGTLFEEDFAQYLLFLLMIVVVLDVVIMRLVEHRIAIVVAVRILIADAPRLTECLVRVERRSALLVLASDEKYAFVEAADDRYLRRRSLLCLALLLLRIRLGLLLR